MAIGIVFVTSFKVVNLTITKEADTVFFVSDWTKL